MSMGSPHRRQDQHRERGTVPRRQLLASRSPPRTAVVVVVAVSVRRSFTGVPTIHPPRQFAVSLPPPIEEDQPAVEPDRTSDHYQRRGVDQEAVEERAGLEGRRRDDDFHAAGEEGAGGGLRPGTLHHRFIDGRGGGESQAATRLHLYTRRRQRRAMMVEG